VLAEAVRRPRLSAAVALDRGSRRPRGTAQHAGTDVQQPCGEDARERVVREPRCVSAARDEDRTLEVRIVGQQRRDSVERLAVEQLAARMLNGGVVKRETDPAGWQDERDTRGCCCCPRRLTPRLDVMRSFVRSVGESKRPPSVAEPNGPSWATTPSLHSCSRVRRAGRPVSCAVRLTRRVPRIERLGRRYLVGCRSSCRRRRRRRRCQRELCCAARCARASRLAGGDSRGACSSRQPNRAKPSPTSLVCRWCVPVWAR